MLCVDGYHREVTGFDGWKNCLVEHCCCFDCDRPCQRERARRQSAELTQALAAPAARTFLKIADFA
jgi:hypothetical protein